MLHIVIVAQLRQLVMPACVEFHLSNKPGSVFLLSPDFHFTTYYLFRLYIPTTWRRGVMPIFMTSVHSMCTTYRLGCPTLRKYESIMQFVTFCATIHLLIVTQIMLCNSHLWILYYRQ